MNAIIPTTTAVAAMKPRLSRDWNMETPLRVMFQRGSTSVPGFSDEFLESHQTERLLSRTVRCAARTTQEHASGTALRDDALTHGVQHDFGRIVQIQLLHEIRPMSLHRGQAQ